MTTLKGSNKTVAMTNQLAKPIWIPVQADFVLSPIVIYDSHDSKMVTGIYFRTEDDTFGRITFNGLDAIKVCRGESMPYSNDYFSQTPRKHDDPYPWVWRVENSLWHLERYQYEKEHYGRSYEWGGDVNEMLTDYSHYHFHFHDQFVDVIASGFWYEKSHENLLGKELPPGHPMLRLQEIKVRHFEKHGIKYKVIDNPLSEEELVHNTAFCPQTLYEIHSEYEGKYSLHWPIKFQRRNDKPTTIVKPIIGKPILVQEGIVPFEKIQAQYEKELAEVAKRRKQMKKHHKG